MSDRPILYEVDNLAARTASGIGTYARALAQSARRLGYQTDALFGVEARLDPRGGPVNEILAFDAPDQKFEPLLRRVTRIVSYPFNALGGLRPLPLPRTGLVVSPLVELLSPFRQVLVSTRLSDVSMVHFRLYQRFATLNLAQRPLLFHATQAIPLKVKGCANIYTIHDLVPLRLPYTTLDDKKIFYRLLKKIAATADHIVTVSEHSRRDIIDFLGVSENRVTNTYQTVDISPDQLARSERDVANDLARLFGLDFGEYYLFYGAIEPKKNIPRMIDAYAGSGTNRPLIIAGGAGWHNQAEMQKINDERFSGFRAEGTMYRRHRQVRRLRYLPQDQLVSLIRGARAVVFPSIYEGFGLPVAEAMLLGTPVITSNSSSLPEVAGDAAYLVNPQSTEDISNAIAVLDKDDDLCAALAERGRVQVTKFSREAYESRLKSLYGMLVG
jgi:glycosyltransferase involved in cell wall biosynthesis